MKVSKQILQQEQVIQSIFKKKKKKIGKFSGVHILLPL